MKYNKVDVVVSANCWTDSRSWRLRQTFFHRNTQYGKYDARKLNVADSELLFLFPGFVCLSENIFITVTMRRYIHPNQQCWSYKYREGILSRIYTRTYSRNTSTLGCTIALPYEGQENILSGTIVDL